MSPVAVDVYPVTECTSVSASADAHSPVQDKRIASLIGRKRGFTVIVLLADIVCSDESESSRFGIGRRANSGQRTVRAVRRIISAGTRGDLVVEIYDPSH